MWPIFKTVVLPADAMGSKKTMIVIIVTMVVKKQDDFLEIFMIPPLLCETLVCKA